jgi:hypothetical protein
LEFRFGDADAIEPAGAEVARFGQLAGMRN